MKHRDFRHTEATADINHQLLAGAPLNAFLTKNLSRQEFLFSLGILLLSLTGIAHVLKLLSQTETAHSSANTRSNFSSGLYGGIQRERSIL
jgi:hypothetical protein